MPFEALAVETSFTLLTLRELLENFPHSGCWDNNEFVKGKSSHQAGDEDPRLSFVSLEFPHLSKKAMLL